MRRAYRCWRCALALGFVSWSPSARALNPALDVSQYAHTSWTNRDGFFNSSVNTIAQTPDGYLWLGTELGLRRFDGVRKIPWQPPAGEHLPSTDVNKLLVARDGRIWIGTLAGLVSWKDGRLVHYPELDGQSIGALLEDHAGTVWAGGLGIPSGRLCAIQGPAIQCFGQDGSLGAFVLSLFEENGHLWAGTQTGLWRWKPGPPKRYSMSTPELRDLIQVDAGPLLIAMNAGVRQLAGQNIEPYPIPGVRQPFSAIRLLRDRNGGLWIGTASNGLLHVHQGRSDWFRRSDGLSGDAVSALFEDREGNIWAATNEGLDRFRDYAVSTVSVNQGLSQDGVSSVLAARDGSVWLGTLGGMNRWQNGQIRVYTNRDGLPADDGDSLFEDDRGRTWVSTSQGMARFDQGRFVPVPQVRTRVVHNIVGGDAGSLWISDQETGLIHVLGDEAVEQIPWAALGHRDHASAVARDPKRGGLWLGFYRGGLAFFQDGQIRESYTTAQGLGAGWVWDLRVEADGSVWASTVTGLSRIKDNHVATINARNGLPCDSVSWTMEDEDRSAWLYMPCGLVRVSRGELEAWAADPNRTVKYTVFDSSEGVRSQAFAHGYSPKAARSSDGRLWFATPSGVSVIDPRDLRLNSVPPPVRVEKITADRNTYWESILSDAPSNPRLPPRVRDLVIDYTALSFVAPEKIRFKYKLEGRDADWVDAGNRRQAFYNDLPPRDYRFRVMAANNSGVWNEAGASLDFSVAPAYYQTTWFRFVIAAAVLALLAVLYQLRLRYLKQQFNVRLEARVGERTRIARDLHDTLLQSFQGTLLKFHAVSYLLPDHPEAKEKLDNCIEQARAAITEGRDAVQGLRSSMVVANDLARAIGTFGKGLVADQPSPNCPEFGVQVAGESRDLPPLVRDEVYHIACESLRNAFRHAQATRIEVEVRYDPRRFRMRVVDNGKGIDPAVLSSGGRAGHHGLPGINERAGLAGGKLSVWSRVDSGTEIELTIPASIAYPKSKTPAAKTAGATEGAG